MNQVHVCIQAFQRNPIHSLNILVKYIKGHTEALIKVLVPLPFMLSTNHMITFLLNHVSYTYTKYDCIVMSFDALFTYIFWYVSIYEYDSIVELLNILKKYWIYCTYIYYLFISTREYLNSKLLTYETRWLDIHLKCEYENIWIVISPYQINVCWETIPSFISSLVNTQYITLSTQTKPNPGR